MKYILGIGLFGELYKQYPTLQVFIGDTLVEEYNPDSIDGEKHYFTKKNPNWYGLKSLPDTEKKLIISSFPKHYKLIFLNEDFLKTQSKLKIKIKNADSNYTNGFMTKSTLLNFSNIFLIRTDMLDAFQTSQNGQWYDRIKNIVPWIKEYQKTEEYAIINQGRYTNICFKGYPYPFKTFWNDEVPEKVAVSTHGGNGELTMDLINKDNLVMFDYYEKELLDSNPSYCGVNNPTVSKELRPSATPILSGAIGIKTEGGSIFEQAEIPGGFPFSLYFFAISRMFNFNK